MILFMNMSIKAASLIVHNRNKFHIEILQIVVHELFFKVCIGDIKRRDKNIIL